LQVAVALSLSAQAEAKTEQITEPGDDEELRAAMALSFADHGILLNSRDQNSFQNFQSY
jgi:hypothetical protein